MKEGFPLLTTKKMAWKTMVTELMWFLRGDTNIKYLWDNNCHIWDGDYKKSGRTDGELGPIYGKQWRSWGAKEKQFNWVVENNQVTGRVLSTKGIDQIQNLIDQLKTNPDSRRLMVSAWNVGELDQMVLPPCHYGFQCYVREGKYLSLMWNQRSVDTFLGLPFNIASYALLLEILAKAVQMIPDQLIGSLGDVHLYSNHIEQAKEQIQREPYELPTLKMNHIFLANLEHKGLDEAINGEVNFEVEGYQSHPSIKAPLSN
jgi:thymidylate synthase